MVQLKTLLYAQLKYTETLLCGLIMDMLRNLERESKREGEGEDTKINDIKKLNSFILVSLSLSFP